MKDCGNEFKLELGEIKFFNEKKLKLPKRCKSCRQKRKQ
ncbi:MAG: zinc-ribbon domain containing protein [Methanofastidiosum sp.]